MKPATLPVVPTREPAAPVVAAAPAVAALPSAARRRGWYWPLLIAALLLVSVGANVLLMLQATADPSYAAEPDYYRKAMAWDSHMAQQAVNQRLGWQVRDVRATATAAGLDVTLRLQDRAGAPLTDTRIEVRAAAIARAHLTATALAEPIAPGHYRVRLPLVGTGLHELQLQVQRGTDVFSAVERCHARP